MAKKITVISKTATTPAIAIEFLQRAHGQETPYYVGVIHEKQGRSWVQVGDFKNNGHGGSTNITRDLEAQFDKVVNEITTRLGIEKLFEPASSVIDYAEMIGYELKCKMEDFTLEDHIAQFWCGEGSFRTLTDAEKALGEAADKKSRKVLGQVYAKKGQTLVYTGTENMVIIKTRDQQVVARIMDAKKIKYEILA